MSLTEGALSPDIFRLWAGISLLGGALERRVWAEAGDYTTYPNLYVLLVAPPGVGKYIIETTRQLWAETIEHGTRARAFHVAPDSMTKASLMDNLVKAKSTKLPPSGPPIVYHSLLIAAEEFSVLLPAYDMDYIGALNSIWTNKALHEESRRTGSVRELKIENPQLNMLGGAAPAWLSTIFPEDAWNTGFGRRVIMIYSSETPIKDIFAKTPDRHEIRQKMLHKLSGFADLYGAARWTPEAVEMLRAWHLAGRPPEPTHSKLVHYKSSRLQLTLKLAIISGVSRTGQPVISEADVKRAWHWLFEAEKLMPDIFRAMIGKSDKQIIDELYLYTMASYARDKAKRGVDGAVLRQFLQDRIPHDKIESLIQSCERAGLLARVAGTADSWVPKPRHEGWGAE